MWTFFYYLYLLLYTHFVYIWSGAYNFESQIPIANLDTYSSQFDKYLAKYNRSYGDSEYYKRLEYFKASLGEASKLNETSIKGKGCATYGVTKFSDMSPEEFRQEILMDYVYTTACEPIKKPCVSGNISDESSIDTNDAKVPQHYDWREEHIVGPVLCQGKCKACWAFSLIGVMETMAAKQTKTFTRLSIQELLDYTQRGCKNGNAVETANRLCNTNNTPITTESAYPLTFKEDEPLTRPTEGWLLTSMEFKCNMTSVAIMSTIAKHGPVVSSANSHTWKNYVDGVIRWHCDDSMLNHVVQIVGYNNTAEVPYYIIRNSWGKDFGINGYLKVAMTDNFVCGIGREILYFDVKKTIGKS